MPTWIYSHNPNSEGANLLKDAMDIKKIKHEGSRFIGGPRKRVINWGASRVSREIEKCQVLNQPEYVRSASNKLDFFNKIGVDHADLLPDFTTSFDRAVEWVGAGNIVVARTILNGHSGAGIVLMESSRPNDFVRAPLYTKYVKKTEEYRVHVVGTEVIDYQRKTLSKTKAESGEEVNWKIRNLDNGFIYQRGGVNPHQSVLDAAVSVLRASQLEFGAVDIVWNSRQERGYVLEINTAPGITGTTVQSYATALRG